MSYRFTDSEKWRKPRFRGFTPEVKLIYLYILDNCDLAGFMEVDNESISFHTGLLLDQIQSCMDILKDKEILSGDGWWFVKNFIKMQKNHPLNPKNHAHKNIIRNLKDKRCHFNNNDDFKEQLAPYEPLLRGTGKDNGNANNKGNGNGTSEPNSFKEEKKKENTPIWKKDFKCTSCGAYKGGYCKLNDPSIPCMVIQPYNMRN